MTLKNLFEAIWNYDFSHWFVYLAVIFGILIHLVMIGRLYANITDFKELKKDFQYFFETIGISIVLFIEIVIAYLIYIK